MAYDPQGLSVVYSGDSRTYGWNADPLESSWRGLLTAETNGTGVNIGQPGGHLQQGGYNTFDPQYTPAKYQNNSKYMWFCYGTNDIKDDPTIYTTAGFKARLIEVLDIFNSEKGWAYNDIILTSVNYFWALEKGSRAKHLATNQAIKEVAQMKNTIYLDVFSYFDALPNKNALLDTVGIHENNAGHRVLADWFKVQDYTPVNGFDLPQTTTTTTTTTTTARPIDGLFLKGKNLIIR